jgi:hypothetical protein
MRIRIFTLRILIRISKGRTLQRYRTAASLIYGRALNRRTVLVDNDLLRLVGNLDVSKLGVEALHRGFAAGQQSDVLQQILTLIT